MNEETDFMDKEHITSEILTSSDSNSLTASWAESAYRASEHNLEVLMSATIMMIDDEPSTIEILQLFLKDYGYKNFVKTTDSTVAFDLVQSERPDVVLLDLMMPKVNGFEILSRLRADKVLKHIPVIVLTSSTDSETKLKALELGANDFLGKPVDSSELALRLRNTLAAKAYQDRLVHCDPLTGLNNRRTFMDHVDWALLNAKRDKAKCAIIQINLDRFKQLNDTLGPKVGDALLIEVAQSLNRSVRASDPFGRVHTGVSLCRVGGDEFTVLLSKIQHEENAAQVARRILEMMEQPFNPEGHETFISASIGIAVFGNDGNETNTLIKHANIAMSHAKRRGGNIYEFYSKDINRRSLERLSLSNQLRKALARQELCLYYQPKVETYTGKVIGAEALMRWVHPSFGVVSPEVFIPLAEDIGIINSLGEWALYTACHQAKSWQSSGFPEFSIAVNVSGRQLLQKEFSSIVKKVLELTELDGKYLELELTESIMMENAVENIKVLNNLRKLKLKLAIDDFGTGYSSLSYLTSYPIDVLKVDRSFVKGIPMHTNNIGVVKAIVAMAHSLNLSIVAEGVETKEQLAFLSKIGCDIVQGFLFSKPVPSEKFISVINRKPCYTYEAVLEPRYEVVT